MHYFDCGGVSVLASFGYLPNDHKARRLQHLGFRPGARLFLLMIFIGQLARFCRSCIKAELASQVGTINSCSSQQSQKAVHYFSLAKARYFIMTKVSRTAVKKVAREAYNRFDMCVSTIFSPFAGVLYTVSAFEKDPEKPSSSSRPSSRASTASSSVVSSRSSSRSSIRDDPPPYSYDV